MEQHHEWRQKRRHRVGEYPSCSVLRRAALSVGFGKEFSKGSHFKWVEELFDYERELGVSAQTVWGIKKNVYNGLDFGTLVATTYAVKHS